MTTEERIQQAHETGRLSGHPRNYIDIADMIEKAESETGLFDSEIRFGFQQLVCLQDMVDCGLVQQKYLLINGEISKPKRLTDRACEYRLTYRKYIRVDEEYDYEAAMIELEALRIRVTELESMLKEKTARLAS